MVVLSTLLALFALRVGAQALQWWRPVSWLPSFAAWQSGVVPYGLLVAAQLLILALEVRIVVAFARGRVAPSPRTARWALAFGAVYATTMTVRLGVGIFVPTSGRWFHAPLPTAFHFVLASFVLVVGAFHRVATSSGDRRLARSAPSRSGLGTGALWSL
jgi:hypothetical protein